MKLKTSWTKVMVIQLVLFIHLIVPIGSSFSPSLRVDLCSSCRGDNSTCRVVAGIFTRPQLSVGYHLVAHIPRGACNLNISEIRNSPNHLALRRKNGTYIVNGDWRLSHSGEYSSAGTTYTYSRQDLKTLESVTSPGPLQESLDLMVLYQQPNPGIKYEYMLHSSLDSSALPPVVPLTQQDSLLSARSIRDYHHFRQAAPATSRPTPYNHHPHQYSGNYRGGRADSSLSSSSSSHLQRPQQDYHHPSPFNSLSAFPVSNTNNNGKQVGGAGGGLPDFGGAPTPGGALLFNNPKGPETLPVYAGHNSNNNGGGHSNGINNGANIVSNSHHLHSHRRRNHKSSSSSSAERKFYWKIMGFTNCTEPCGGGMQRSIVRCVRGTATTASSASTGNIVSDRRCSSEDKPPAQVIRCNLKPCPAEWIIGDWSSCASVSAVNSDCGEGFKTRTVHCQQRVSPTLTMRVAEGACLQQRPESRVSCQLRPCNHWRTSEWSQCSAHCGNGIRKRSVACVTGSSIEPGRVTGAEECDQSEKPAELTPCNMGPCEGVDWFSSEWNNDCSQQCGNGIQTRHVVCSVLHPQQPQQLPSQYYSYEHPQYQNASKRRSPSSSELEASNEATANPGESQLETPISSPATTSFQFQESSQILSCEENKMPPEERECFSDRACGDPRWFTGDWSQCTASCANGVRTRQVLCVLFTRGRFKVVQDEHCALDTKPGDKETCLGTQECPHRWFTTEWSECSALCGGGMQKRSVSCRHAANWTLTSSLCADKDRPVERKSCNEQKCTLTPVSPSAASNYTRPIQQDYGPTSEPSPSPVTPSHHHHRHQKSQAHTTTSSPPSIDEDKEDADCSDQYRNCALVVQARLCRYKYYRSVCCQSCSDAAVF